MRVRVALLPLIGIFKLCNDKNEGRGVDMEQKDDSTGNLTLAVLAALAFLRAFAVVATLAVLAALAFLHALAMITTLAVLAALALLAALAFLHALAMITTLAFLRAFALLAALAFLHALTLHRTIRTTHYQNKSNSK